MRKKKCKGCLCKSCMQNAEDYADGMCRECEQCVIDERDEGLGYCKYYTNDDDPSGFI